MAMKVLVIASGSSGPNRELCRNGLEASTDCSEGGAVPELTFGLSFLITRRRRRPAAGWRPQARRSRAVFCRRSRRYHLFSGRSSIGLEGRCSCFRRRGAISTPARTSVADRDAQQLDTQRVTRRLRAAAADVLIAHHAHRLQALAGQLDGTPAPRPPLGGQGDLALAIRSLPLRPAPDAICGDLSPIQGVGGVAPPGVVFQALAGAHGTIGGVEL